MMKSSSTPRQVYTRNAVTCICFEGRTFGPTGSTAVLTDFTVSVEKLPSDGGRARVQVTQFIKGKNVTVKETWRSVNVPRKPRA